MADVFEDRRELDASREKLWKVIEETPQLDWLLLTKRPENVSELVPWKGAWPENIWLGATAENQRWLDKRMPALVMSPAKVIFLSCEPLLGPLDLSRWIEEARQGTHRKIDWVIGGGESGHHARPMHPEWLTGLRDQCVHAGIRFHFKQWGNWRQVLPHQVNGHTSKILFHSNGARITIANVGKKVAGRRVEGRVWDEIPRRAPSWKD